MDEISQLLFFSPRGLITILLFISIPAGSRIPFMNDEVITIVILFTIIVMMIGNMLYRRPGAPEISNPSSGESVNKG